MSEIRIYVEGGGDKDSKAALRVGFGQFLDSFRQQARRGKVRWHVIACGSRESAYEQFCDAVEDHADAFSLLLVDSETRVTGTAREHLRRGDGWVLDGVAEDQVHLMAQAMEAWLIADVEALGAFYGKGFAAAALPRTPNVEAISKDDLEPALKRATRGTTKGEYHKTRHGFDIVARLDPEKVRKRAPHCERLFETIQRHLTF